MSTPFRPNHVRANFGEYMEYTVIWKKLPEMVVVRSEDYIDLEQALEEANVINVGPGAIEITVVDEAGDEHYKKLIG